MAEGLDLRGIKQVVRTFLVDELLVQRNRDTQLDEDTGRLLPVEPLTIYSGLGAVQPISRVVNEREDDLATAQIIDDTGATHRLLLPVDTAGAVEFAYGDDVRVVEARGFTPDPRATETRWKVVHVGTTSTWTVVRFVFLAETDPA